MKIKNFRMGGVFVIFVSMILVFFAGIILINSNTISINDDNDNTVYAAVTPGYTASGLCQGGNVSWYFYQGSSNGSGTLILDGTGEMGYLNFSDSYKDNVGTLVIGDGITSLYTDAFSKTNVIGSKEFRYLSTIMIGNSLSSIGYSNFKYCYNLSNIIVDSNNNNFKVIDGVLYNKNGTSLILYPGYTKEDVTFEVPYGVQRIEDNAFLGDTTEGYLETLIISSTVNYIGSDVLGNWVMPSTIVIKSRSLAANPMWSVGYWPFWYSSIDDAAVWEVNRFDITYEESLERFKLYVPDQVINLYKNNTLSLYENHIQAITEWSGYVGGGCGDDAYWEYDGSNAGIITIFGSGDMYDYESNNSPWYDLIFDEQVESVVVEEGITRIGENAFFGCDSCLMYLTLPRTCESIGDSAFANAGFTALTIPEGVISIGVSSFDGVNELINLSLPTTLESIGDSAFYGNHLTNLILPANIEEIGDYAFTQEEGCETLKTINILGNKIELINEDQGAWFFSNDSCDMFFDEDNYSGWAYEHGYIINFPNNTIKQHYIDAANNGDGAWAKYYEAGLFGVDVNLQVLVNNSNSSISPETGVIADIIIPSIVIVSLIGAVCYVLIGRKKKRI